eukprot:TRINITY_DN4819_c7_g1_i1.p1 TRINITY_DN4819_c7_g1~~TRINITY_DN4819_c7_g1_i1.p1  ORF type:complete len:254 (+),score=19.09 TRINITY_DN4819_c7_g1_i1:53-814(+)
MSTSEEASSQEGESWQSQTMEVTVVRHGEGLHNINTQDILDSSYSLLNNVISLSFGSAISDSKRILAGAMRATQLRDPELTEDGRLQAKQLQDTILSNTYDLVVVSPMIRTIQTALEVFGNSDKHTLILHPLCCETRILLEGSNAGTLKADLQAIITEYCASRSFSVKIDYSLLPDDEWWVSYTETSSNLKFRAAAFQQYLLSTGCSSALVVSHGTFLHHLTGASLATGESRPYNCSVDGFQPLDAPDSQTDM